MSKYTVTRGSVALNTAADTLTLIAAANRAALINYIYIGALGVAAAANEVGIYFASTVGATPSGAIVPQGKDPWMAPTAATTSATGWTTQPLIANPPLLRAALNANGGQWFWQAIKGEEFRLQNAGNFCIRAISGTSLVTVTVGFEE